MQKSEDEQHSIQVDIPLWEAPDAKSGYHGVMLNLKYFADHNLAFRLVCISGPGGGQPVVELSGKVSDLRTWAEEWYYGGMGDAKDIEFTLFGDNDEGPLWVLRDDDGTFPESDGFEHEGQRIHNPWYDSSGRFGVEPARVYGVDALLFLERHPTSKEDQENNPSAMYVSP